MGPQRRGDLDPRAWIAWSFAASLPSLLGRNPWPLLMTLLAVVAVRVAWSERMASSWSWALFLRIALIFSVVSVVFNILTVRAGDRVIANVPDSIPLIGGDITLNAAFFGILSGLALVILVMIGSTVAGLLDWSAIVRLMPNGMTNIAVAGSIAFAFVPQTAISFREIREAQSARGHRIRGARDLLPILVPMIGGGLERSITLAEALESRSFGTPTDPAAIAPRWSGYLSSLGLAAGAIAIYLLAAGYVVAAVGIALFGLLSLLLVAKANRGLVRQRTQYRVLNWNGRDSGVLLGSLIAIMTTLLVLENNPGALRYEPYPRLTIPTVDLRLLAGLFGLLVPVLVAPPPEKAS